MNPGERVFFDEKLIQTAATRRAGDPGSGQKSTSTSLSARLRSIDGAALSDRPVISRKSVTK